MAISYIGAASGTTSATVPAHVSGDLLIAWAYRDGSTTAPTLPSGWTSASSAGANSNAAVLAWRISDGTATSGTWTNASRLLIAVYRGASGVGAVATGGAASTSVTYPALTLQGASSWCARFAGHRSVNTTLEAAPTGYTQRSTLVDATCETVAHDSGAVVASVAADTVAVGGTSSGWRAVSVELLAATVSAGITGGGGGTGGYVGCTSGCGNLYQSTGRTLSVTVSAAGAGLVLWLCALPELADDTPPNWSVSDSSGAVWSVLGQSWVSDTEGGGGTVCNVTALVCASAPVGAHTLTVSTGGVLISSWSWCCVEMQPGGTWVAGAGQALRTGTPISVGAVALSGPGVLLSGMTDFGESQTGEGLAPSAGWTAVSLQQLGYYTGAQFAPLGVARQTLAAAGSAGITWSWTSGYSYAAAAHTVGWLAPASSPTPRRALTLQGGSLRQVVAAELGTGLAPAVLLGGAIKVRASAEGQPLVLVGGQLRTLASGETLEI